MDRHQAQDRADELLKLLIQHQQLFAALNPQELNGTKIAGQIAAIRKGLTDAILQQSKPDS